MHHQNDSHNIHRVHSHSHITHTATLAHSNQNKKTCVAVHYSAIHIYSFSFFPLLHQIPFHVHSLIFLMLAWKTNRNPHLVSKLTSKLTAYKPKPKQLNPNSKLDFHRYSNSRAQEYFAECRQFALNSPLFHFLWFLESNTNAYTQHTCLLTQFRVDIFSTEWGNSPDVPPWAFHYWKTQKMPFVND